MSSPKTQSEENLSSFHKRPSERAQHATNDVKNTILSSVTFPAVTGSYVWPVAEIHDEWNTQKGQNLEGPIKTEHFLFKGINFFQGMWLGFLSWKTQAFEAENSDGEGWLKEQSTRRNVPCSELQWALKWNCWELHKEEERIETEWRTSRFTASLKAAGGMTPLLSLSNLFHLSSHTPSLGLLK